MHAGDRTAKRAGFGPPASAPAKESPAAAESFAGETPAVQVSQTECTKIRAILADVPDPEIPVLSVLDLGIVREIGAGDAREIIITPTYTGCPAALAIEQAIRAALDANGFDDVRLRTVLSPPWTTDWISDEGREKLRAYGIAPPPKGADAASLRNAEPAQCTRCGSSDTEEISRFGSTPCKALWRCRACAEPFDRFKCH